MDEVILDSLNLGFFHLGWLISKKNSIHARLYFFSSFFPFPLALSAGVTAFFSSLGYGEKKILKT